MSELNSLQNEALAFRDARDWAQFHNTKDLAAGLSIEASELLECFLWKDAKSADPAKIREELADVLVYEDHEGLVDTELEGQEKDGHIHGGVLADLNRLELAREALRETVFVGLNTYARFGAWVDRGFGCALVRCTA